MTSVHIEDSSIFTHPLRAAGHYISDIIENAPSVSNLKDANTRGYILGNQHEVEFSGLTSKEIVGLKIEDIHMGLYTGSKDELVKMINTIDEKVLQNKCPVLSQEVLLTNDGYIRVVHLLKMPVLSGAEGKSVAIFSYTDDFTSRCDLFDLFSLYRRHYLPKQAVSQFLGYLKIGIHFQEIPTCMELSTLIALSIDSSHKQAAKTLKINPGTVACYSSLLKQKYKNGVNLDIILRAIRERQNTYSIKDRLAIKSL